MLLWDNYFVKNLLSQVMILTEEGWKEMNISNLFTASYDSLTDLSARGENAEVWLKRRDYKCFFAAQTCVRGPDPCLHKMIFADVKGFDDNVKEKLIWLSFRLLLFQETIRLK